MPDEQEMADYDAVMANKPEEAEESVEESSSTSLKDNEDYKAKKKALQDIQMDPNTHKDEELKKELMRRKAELEDEAKKKGIKEEPETTMSIPAKEVQLAGDSIWDKEGENPKSVKVSKIEVENLLSHGFLHGDEDDGYRKVDVTHDGWTIYTDSGFAKEISKMVKMNVDFTEQGMQKDGVASMETTNEMREVSEAEDKPYICVHADKGKHECHAKSSYEAAKKAAAHWKMKSTAGIDAHLAEESAMIEEGAMDTLKKIVADKQNMPVKFDDGQMKVDLFTASAVTQVYDKVNDANKEKIDNMLKTKAGMLKIADFAHGSMKEGKLVAENPLLLKVAGAIGKGVKKGMELTKKYDKFSKSDKGKAMKMGAKIVGKGLAGAAKAGVNFTKDELNKANPNLGLVRKKIFNSDDYADELVNRSLKSICQSTMNSTKN